MRENTIDTWVFAVVFFGRLGNKIGSQTRLWEGEQVCLRREPDGGRRTDAEGAKGRVRRRLARGVYVHGCAQWDEEQRCRTVATGALSLGLGRCPWDERRTLPMGLCRRLPLDLSSPPVSRRSNGDRYSPLSSTTHDRGWEGTGLGDPSTQNFPNSRGEERLPDIKESPVGYDRFPAISTICSYLLILARCTETPGMTYQRALPFISRTEILVKVLTVCMSV